MPGLEATIGKLLSTRRRWETLMGGGQTGAQMPGMQPAQDGRLHAVTAFGDNPGALGMKVHVPEGLPPGAPLVVVLHGCTQTASGYDLASGWSALADRHGFAVLCPEQQRANNANLCFNWFVPADVAREGGELASIRNMVSAALASWRLDARRVFVTGLSAGAAMTAALLAACPDLFAAGAIIAGLPYGCATTTQEALDCMFHGHALPASAWGDKVRGAHPGYRGPWPQVAIWHGTADHTVVPANAEELVKQWVDVHGLSEAPSQRDTVDGCAHRVWRGRDGAPLVSAFLVPGLGHGTPIDPQSSDPARRYGQAAPHMLDVGVASTVHIAAGWGLLRDRLTGEPAPRTAPANDPAALVARALRSVGLAGLGRR